MRLGIPWELGVWWHDHVALPWRRRQVNRAIRVLDALDWNMRHAGWTRQERRQFWRDYVKDASVRFDTLNKLTQR